MEPFRMNKLQSKFPTVISFNTNFTPTILIKNWIYTICFVSCLCPQVYQVIWGFPGMNLFSFQTEGEKSQAEVLSGVNGISDWEGRLTIYIIWNILIFEMFLWEIKLKLVMIWSFFFSILCIFILCNQSTLDWFKLDDKTLYLYKDFFI